MSKAHEAVDAILADLTDRGGFGGTWDGIDDDIRAEIRAELVKHVEAAISAALLEQSQ